MGKTCVDQEPSFPNQLPDGSRERGGGRDAISAMLRSKSCLTCHLVEFPDINCEDRATYHINPRARLWRIGVRKYPYARLDAWPNSVIDQ